MLQMFNCTLRKTTWQMIATETTKIICVEHIIAVCSWHLTGKAIKKSKEISITRRFNTMHFNSDNYNKVSIAMLSTHTYRVWLMNLIMMQMSVAQQFECYFVHAISVIVSLCSCVLSISLSLSLLSCSLFLFLRFSFSVLFSFYFLLLCWSRELVVKI